MSKNKYQYIIFKDKKLIIETLSGSFDLFDYNDFKHTEFLDSDFDPDFNLILDIRNIKDLVSQKKIKQYPEKLKHLQNYTRRIKVAVVTQTATQVAGASLYNLFENTDIDYKIFSTPEFALRWVGFSENEIEIFDYKF